MHERLLGVGVFAILLVFFSSVPCLSDNSVDNPHIVHDKNGQVSLHLTSMMSTALKTFDPEFSVWQMSDYPGWFTDLYVYDYMYAPFAVVGDFNGDGVLDAAMEGNNGKFERTIVLLSEEESFGVIAVRDGSSESFSRGASSALFKASPGIYISPVDEEALELKEDGFGTALIGKGLSAVYYYEDGEFKRFLTGD